MFYQSFVIIWIICFRHLLAIGEFCSGLEQREQATGTEWGIVDMSIGMSGSKVAWNVVWLLVHLSVFIKKEKRRIFSYLTAAYPLAKSISLQGLRLVLKPTKLLEPYFIVFTCSRRPSWHRNMVPLEVLGRWPLNCVQLWPKGLWSTCWKRYMAARKMSHQYHGMKWSWTFAKKCTTLAAVKDDKMMKHIPTKWKDHGFQNNLL